MPSKSANDELLLNTAAAGAAGACQCALFNPLDCLRIRWQVADGGASTMTEFASKIVLEEGWWGGLHRPGLFTNMLGVALSQGLRMGLYPSVRDAVAEGGSVRPDLMVLSGLLSGSFAYLVRRTRAHSIAHAVTYARAACRF